MELDYTTLEWVADYFLPFGKHATILEPTELRFFFYDFFDTVNAECSDLIGFGAIGRTIPSQALQFYRDLPFEQETISVLKKFLNCLPLDIQNSIARR